MSPPLLSREDTMRRDLAEIFDVNILADQIATKPESVIVEPKPDATENLLTTRGATHGDFGDNARISQALKRTFRAEPGWELLTDTEREALDMIALKFSRLLSGKALELQHWEDVVGYAKLAEKLCKPVGEV